MKVQVDMEVCQNYGQCVFVAPEVFDLDDNGELVYQEVVDDGARPEIESAVIACPVQAISILD